MLNNRNRPPSRSHLRKQLLFLAVLLSLAAFIDDHHFCLFK